MRISKKVAGAASLIAIATAVACVQPSNASNLVNLVQNTLANNCIDTTHGAWGRDVRDYRFANRFDNRFNVALNQVRDNIIRLQNKVETGKLQHRLSINEYNLFKDRLAQQDRKCDQFASSDNRFDQREFDRMTETLNKLDSLIATSLSSRPYPTAYGNRFG